MCIITAENIVVVALVAGGNVRVCSEADLMEVDVGGLLKSRRDRSRPERASRKRVTQEWWVKNQEQRTRRKKEGKEGKASLASTERKHRLALVAPLLGRCLNPRAGG